MEEIMIDREALAAYAHEAWSGWMRHLFRLSITRPFQAVLVPGNLARRWKRLVDTPYADLTEEEKESDRREADKMIAIMRGE